MQACTRRPQPVPQDLLKPKSRELLLAPVMQHSHAHCREKQGQQHSVTVRMSGKGCPEAAIVDFSFHRGPQQGNSHHRDAVSHQKQPTTKTSSSHQLFPKSQMPFPRITSIKANRTGPRRNNCFAFLQQQPACQRN